MAVSNNRGERHTSPARAPTMSIARFQTGIRSANKPSGHSLHRTDVSFGLASAAEDPSAREAELRIALGTPGALPPSAGNPRPGYVWIVYVGGDPAVMRQISSASVFAPLDEV